jgi:hypothetical protein
MGNPGDNPTFNKQVIQNKSNMEYTRTHSYVFTDNLEHDLEFSKFYLFFDEDTRKEFLKETQKYGDDGEKILSLLGQGIPVREICNKVLDKEGNPVDVESYIMDVISQEPDVFIKLEDYYIQQGLNSHKLPDGLRDQFKKALEDIEEGKYAYWDELDRQADEDYMRRHPY